MCCTNSSISQPRSLIPPVLPSSDTVALPLVWVEVEGEGEAHDEVEKVLAANSIEDPPLLVVITAAAGVELIVVLSVMGLLLLEYSDFIERELLRVGIISERIARVDA
ncbi:unnamed protein product [Meganyctiphanes norvegica]|uniref:Uncharacterized protein n=1 Tax=Meganyctiphanes norvegica TaxID=48144 RepID=A0AAV2QV05_MEGNR